MDYWDRLIGKADKPPSYSDVKSMFTSLRRDIKSFVKAQMPEKREPVIEVRERIVHSGISEEDLHNAIDRASKIAFADGVKHGLAGRQERLDAAEEARLKRVEEQRATDFKAYWREWRKERALEDAELAAEEAAANAEAQELATDKIKRSQVRAI